MSRACSRREQPPDPPSPLLACSSVGSNLLTGSMPSSFSALTQLQFLEMSKNKLEGTLSPLADLAGAAEGLSHLLLGKNSFTGSIPAALLSSKHHNREVEPLPFQQPVHQPDRVHHLCARTIARCNLCVLRVALRVASRVARRVACCITCCVLCLRLRLIGPSPFN
jgi:hypothetical protein